MAHVSDDMMGYCATCAHSETLEDAGQYCVSQLAADGLAGANPLGTRRALIRRRDVSDYIGGPARAPRPRWCPGWESAGG